jgi:hypothetical protein
MQKWASVALVVGALFSAQAALAETPPEIYDDFAEDGVLSCGHSRSALKAALTDASFHQYAEPWTFLGLKLAIRKQLAGGCRRGQRTRPFPGTPAGAPTAPAGPQSQPRRSRASDERAKTRPQEKATSNQPTREAARIETAGGRDGWMVLLGVVLLLLTLGSGGWAARRAFTD